MRKIPALAAALLLLPFAMPASSAALVPSETVMPVTGLVAQWDRVHSGDWCDSMSGTITRSDPTGTGGIVTYRIQITSFDAVIDLTLPQTDPFAIFSGDGFRGQGIATGRVWLPECGIAIEEHVAVVTLEAFNMCPNGGNAVNMLIELAQAEIGFSGGAFPCATTYGEPILPDPTPIP